MPYVLIFMAFTSQFDGQYRMPKTGVYVAMQEFSSRRACENAAAAIRAMAGDKPIGLTCQPKE